MRITLNGNVYELAPGSKVQREPIIEFPGNTRQQGQQTRNDRALMSSWPFTDFTFGSGIERMDVDRERDKLSWWKSTVDTRWRGKVFLPPLLYQCQVGSSAIGTIHGLGMMLEDTQKTMLACIIPSQANRVNFGLADYDPEPEPHFAYHQTIVPDGTTSGIVSLKMIDYEPEDDKFYYYIGKAAAAGIMTRDRSDVNANPTLNVDTRGTGFNDKWYECSRFYRYIGTMHIGVLDKKHAKAFVHPVMSGTYEVDTGVFQKDFFSPPQLAHTPDGLFAGGSRGVFLLNLVQRTYTEKKDLTAMTNAYNSRDMCPWGNEYLIVPYRSPYGLGGLAAFNTVNNLDIRIGMDIDDGVPSGWSSEVASLLPTPDFVFAASARPVSSFPSGGWIPPRYGNGKVFAYDGYGWHYMASVPSRSEANNYSIRQLLISSRSDGIPKLWIVPTGAGTLGGDDPYQFAPMFVKYPLTHPLEQTGYEFATQGELTLPIFNGGMPEYKGTFFDYVIETNTLGSGRQIEVLYGLNGAEPTQSLGIATQNGVSILQFGGGLGVEGYSVQMNHILTRGPDNTQSPVIITHSSPLLHYMKFPSKRETFRFMVDLVETQRSTRKSPKDSMDKLFAVATTNTLVPFFYGHIGTKNVKMLSMVSQLESDDRIFTGDAEGLVEVTLAELQ